MARPAHEHGRFYLAGERVLAWMDSHYKSALRGVMAMRWWVVGGAFVIGLSLLSSLRWNRRNPA